MSDVRVRYLTYKPFGSLARNVSPGQASSRLAASRVPLCSSSSLKHQRGKDLAAMSGSHVIKGLTRAIGDRAVHLRLVPRPEGIGESRVIIQLLQQYGKVEMFKNLKYDKIPAPNTMLAVFQTEEAASKLLFSSPLRFHMSLDHIEERVGENENEVQAGSESESQSESESAHETSSDRMALAETETAARQSSAHSSDSAASTREYQLVVNHSTMHHRDHINVHPYNGPFAIDTKSAIQEDLAKRVPLIGLSEVNLKKNDKPWRALLWERERERKDRKTLRDMLHHPSDLTRRDHLPS
ncbi:hypothetical protein BDV97DRAFT_122453 [Delphinella strobiligena]|nr:hypothetical protein BDV97DRAFT_122453 [Delphinella strobiligena]